MENYYSLRPHAHAPGLGFLLKSIMLLLALLMLASCSKPDIDQIYTGKYYWGAEVNSFTPCNSDTSYWVSYNWAGIEMNAFYKKHSKTAYQPMYIEATAYMKK